MSNKRIKLIKCRNCYFFDDTAVVKDGKEEYKLRCTWDGTEIPDYDYSPDKCLWFKYSADAWQEYAE